MGEKRHIRMISPVLQSGDWTPENTYEETLRPMEHERLKLSSVFLDRGPHSIEYRMEEAMLVPDLVTKAVEAEREGVDGLVVDCMADPGVDVLRECVSIPVVGRWAWTTFDANCNASWSSVQHSGRTRHCRSSV